MSGKRKEKIEIKENVYKKEKKKYVERKRKKKLNNPSAVADSQITLPRGFEYTRMCKSVCRHLFSHSTKHLKRN